MIIWSGKKVKKAGFKFQLSFSTCTVLYVSAGTRGKNKNYGRKIKFTDLAGFEPTRAKPSRFQVCPVNHSGTSPSGSCVFAYRINLIITLANSKNHLPEQICRNIRSKRPFLCSYALSTVGLPCTRVWLYLLSVPLTSASSSYWALC